MQKQVKQAVRQVLEEAGSTPRLVNLSDGERLTWMIARAFVLGTDTKTNKASKKGTAGNERRKH